MEEVSQAIIGYHDSILGQLTALFKIAEKAREKNIDPKQFPECRLAKDLAERAEKLIGLDGLAEAIRTLQKNGQTSKEEVAFAIAREIVYNEFKKFDALDEAATCAVRTALALLTDGITAAPLEGIDSAKIKKNDDGTEYLAVYFAGPMRSAGGTEQALCVVIADYIRRLLHLDRYKPKENEVNRFMEEIRLYQVRVSRFQYHATEEELRKAILYTPIEVTGVGTDPVEVVINRDLPRIETNNVRGGALRVLNDGVLSKAAKLRKIIEKTGLADWEWLADIGKREELAEEEKVKPNDKYLIDFVAGRPVLGYPSRRGGLRLRYGRSRNTGIAAVGINPATMKILDDFVAIGTQLRTERPGKSAVVTPVDTIEGPIVRLRNGDVVKVKTVEQAEELFPQVETILFLGDILVAIGEFIENGHPLMPSGYCEEWWAKELVLSIDERFESNWEEASQTLQIDREKLKSYATVPLLNTPTEREALSIASTLDIPIHPAYSPFWENTTHAELVTLKKSLEKANVEIGAERASITIPSGQEEKAILERLCLPHRNSETTTTIEDGALSLMACLGVRPKNAPEGIHTSLDAFNSIKKRTGISLRPKAPTTIGCRVGRPEKAKERKMKPPVHLLFPVGHLGGPRRDLLKAASHGKVAVEIARRRCVSCNALTIYPICARCQKGTVVENVCQSCGRTTTEPRCPICKGTAMPWEMREIELAQELEYAFQKVGGREIQRLKGVKGLTSAEKSPEPIEKGILRAKHGLHVYKDGTIRFDMVNAPLTHFKPVEIGLTVEKAIELGYVTDRTGTPLTRIEQVVELRPQDVVISKSSASHLMRVAAFIDELLLKVYGLDPFYNISRYDELIGQIIVGIAPHTSAGIIGRIVGFVDAEVCYGHPYWHQAKRRNADGDEDSLTLALDALLNFSRSHLPKSRGGLMDAPLLVIPIVDPLEIDDEVYNMENISSYPIELYDSASRFVDPKKVAGQIETVGKKVYSKTKYTGFTYTHETSRIDSGPKTSRYKTLRTMEEKVSNQLRVEEMLQAVDTADVALRLVQSHFLKDFTGNLRAFASQKFRCTACGRTYRRIPTMRRCRICQGPLLLSVHEKSIRKYLGLLHDIAERYHLDPYLNQRIDILENGLATLIQTGATQTRLSRFLKTQAEAG